jgi:hypothetical protein
MSTFYAHTGPSKDDWQPLRKHLEQVAGLARQRLEEARPGDAALSEAAYAAGMLHDLGKYRPAHRSKRQDDRRHCADLGQLHGRHHGRGPRRRAGADRRELGFLTAHPGNRICPTSRRTPHCRTRSCRGRSRFGSCAPSPVGRLAGMAETPLGSRCFGFLLQRTTPDTFILPFVFSGLEQGVWRSSLLCLRIFLKIIFVFFHGLESNG